MNALFLPSSPGILLKFKIPFNIFMQKCYAQNPPVTKLNVGSLQALRDIDLI